jgi:hypothetical protein
VVGDRDEVVAHRVARKAIASSGVRSALASSEMHV